MRISDREMASPGKWLDRGYEVPRYDRAEMRRLTRENPVWIHFGGGNIFRAFIADYMEQLLNDGQAERGVIAASGEGSIRSAYRAADDLCLAVTLHFDGSVSKKVLGCVAESLIIGGEAEDTDRLREVFEAPSLQMASFTITEKGYRIKDADGMYYPEVLRDFENGPARPESYMGKIASLIFARWECGAKPLALVSMDNYSHNGEKLRETLLAFAARWTEGGRTPRGFLDYVGDEGRVAFPWTMIDKITPSPDPEVRAMLVRDGVEGLTGTVTERGTSAASFVNAEETGYLVVEDSFPNGRPPLEKAGVIFADRGTVDRAEQMKVCTCLNPIHTALAIFGCLLGFRYIRDEMKDSQLRALAEGIGIKEGLPVVTDPGILSPEEFIRTVLTKRLPNPFIPDSPQRIATDSSQKIPVRYGRTLAEYVRRPDRDPRELVYIPLVFAGFLRYLLGVDDGGQPMELSPDPMKETLRAQLAGVTIEPQYIPEGTLEPILKNAELFGFDLYEIGLGERVVQYFCEMTAGFGAVRRTLEAIEKK